MQLRSAAVLTCLLVAPAAFGLAWTGCATAGSEVDAVPKRAPRDSANDETTIIDDDGGVIVPGDGGELCTKATTMNTCATAIESGAVGVGGTKTMNEGIGSTGDLWYKVQFDELTKLTAHPRIVLTSTDPNIVMEVVKTCAGEVEMCGDEDAMARNIKEYENKYTWDGGVINDGAVDEAGGGAEAGLFVPISVGTAGAVYVHVFRAPGAKTSCDFKLEITN